MIRPWIDPRPTPDPPRTTPKPSRIDVVSTWDHPQIALGTTNDQQGTHTSSRGAHLLDPCIEPKSAQDRPRTAKSCRSAFDPKFTLARIDPGSTPHRHDIDPRSSPNSPFVGLGPRSDSRSIPGRQMAGPIPTLDRPNVEHGSTADRLLPPISDRPRIGLMSIPDRCSIAPAPARDPPRNE